jgi:predicted nucleic-acid-binding protein
MTALLDANVVLRHLLADEAAQSPRATALVAALGGGERRAILIEPVVFETVYVLERQVGYQRNVVRDLVKGLFDLRGLVVINKSLLIAALDLHADRSVSLVDAYVAVQAFRESPSEVISFDRDFDRIPCVTRVEP